jgi:hypothetical protein
MANGFYERQRRPGPCRPRRVVDCHGRFSAPALLLDNPHGCFVLLRVLKIAAKPFGSVDEAPTACDHSGRGLPKRGTDVSIKVDKWKRQRMGAIDGLGCGE